MSDPTVGMDPSALKLVLARVGQFYPSSVAVMPMVCRAWRANAPPRTLNPVVAAAGDGFSALMDCFEPPSSTDLVEVIVYAAAGGHVDIMEVAVSRWQPDRYQQNFEMVPDSHWLGVGQLGVGRELEEPIKGVFFDALIAASKGNHVEVVDLLLSWNVTLGTIDAYVEADLRDHTEVMERLEHFTFPASELIVVGACRGAVRSMKLALKRGASYKSIARATDAAATYGHIAGIQVMLEHDPHATPKGCLLIVARRGHCDAMRYLRNDCGVDSVEDANDALYEAALGKQIGAMRLAKFEWGATDVTRALNAPSPCLNRVNVMQLLLECGARHTSFTLVMVIISDDVTTLRFLFANGIPADADVSSLAVRAKLTGSKHCLAFLCEEYGAADLVENAFDRAKEIMKSNLLAKYHKYPPAASVELKRKADASADGDDRTAKKRRED